MGARGLKRGDEEASRNEQPNAKNRLRVRGRDGLGSEMYDVLRVNPQKYCKYLRFHLTERVVLRGAATEQVRCLER